MHHVALGLMGRRTCIKGEGGICFREAKIRAWAVWTDGTQTGEGDVSQMTLEACFHYLVGPTKLCDAQPSRGGDV